MKNINNNDITKDVVIIGDVLMDYQYWVEKMPEPGGDSKIIMSKKNPGGSAANTAIALEFLNVSSIFCGRLGKDETGREILKKMKSTGMDISCIQYGENTGYTLTFIEKNGERTMFSYRSTAEERFVFTQELSFFIENAKLLLLSGYLLTNELQAEFILKAAKTIKQTGGIVALDTSPQITTVKKDILQRMFALTDILLPNKRELQLITGFDDIQQALASAIMKTPCIAVKLGNEGSKMMIHEDFKSKYGIEYTDREHFSASSVHVVPVDTTGAGDAFNAGFIYSFLNNEKPQKWLETGNSLAGKVIAEKGAISHYIRS